ncbi:MAG: type IV pili twitching motility protein PilT [Nitrospirae bacterium GWB2_47_37]|nr:MAG: type IV pili twitching motility protein PilT [Nitrospirae bacterium GWA2_46_11]OGW23337.1 MAG: type IV pili twitching motility protein PilT [Nitrospirae bacterium GWB2_47_37]HAK87805.1 type IV pili twitching motility protein PilT [Nitrospiraceae bacterium]
MDINELLKSACSLKASDIHIKVGSPPVFRVNGVLVPQKALPVIKPEDALRMVLSVIGPRQKEIFEKTHDVDFSYSIPGIGRFRCNAFQQRGTAGLVFRIIPFGIPKIDELFMPDVIKKIASEERGIILVTGTTGSGKSTTLAAIIDYINSGRSVNIMTIEDPIEYIHKDAAGIVSQRQIGEDTESFGKALRAALRQDPDVILVGEMRDLETIEIALTAAETGHLVLSTLHTLDAAETVNRIISVFPSNQQNQIRIQLATVLKGVISQRLVPKADGKGRVPAVEVLIATATVRSSILDPEKTSAIRDVIAQGKNLYGMQTFDQSLFDLLQAGLITYDEAVRQATNPSDFALKVKGIQSGGDVALESNKEQKTDEFKIERF